MGAWSLAQQLPVARIIKVERGRCDCSPSGRVRLWARCAGWVVPACRGIDCLVVKATAGIVQPPHRMHALTRPRWRLWASLPIVTGHLPLGHRPPPKKTRSRTSASWFGWEFVYNARTELSGSSEQCSPQRTNWLSTSRPSYTAVQPIKSWRWCWWPRTCRVTRSTCYRSGHFVCCKQTFRVWIIWGAYVHESRWWFSGGGSDQRSLRVYAGAGETAVSTCVRHSRWQQMCVTDRTVIHETVGSLNRLSMASSDLLSLLPVILWVTYQFSCRVEQSVDCVCVCVCGLITLEQSDRRPGYLTR